MPPSDQVSAAQSIYTSRSATYDDSWHTVLARDMIDAAALQLGNTVLDLACGTGLLTLLAQEKVGPRGNVVGVDITRAMMDEGKKKAAAKGIPEGRGEGRIEWIEHDISALQTCAALSGRESTFDVILCCSALVLLQDPYAAVKSWSHYLRPGTGRMIIDVPTPSSSRSLVVMDEVTTALGKSLSFNRAWVAGPQSLPSLYAQAGMEVEKSWETESYISERMQPRDMAGEVFERLSKSRIWANVYEEGDGVVEDARKRFVELFERVSDQEEGGKGVMDYHRLYIAVGRRLD